MKLNVRALALANGTVMAIGYVICFGLFAVAPDETRSVVGYVMHVDTSGLTRVLSWDRFFVGLAAWTALWAAAGATLAGFYNRLVERQPVGNIRHERARSA